MRTRRGWIGAVGAALAMAVAGSSLQAQNIGVAAGVSSYDLSGTGWAPFVAGRYDTPVGSESWLQVSLGVFRYEAQFGDDRTHLFPEAGFFTPLPVGFLPLYLGAGGGYSMILRGPGEDDFTLFAAAGADWVTEGGLTVSPEVRLRAVDPWVGVTADFTVGVGWYVGGN